MALERNRSLRLVELQLESSEVGVAAARSEFSIQLNPSGQAAADSEGGQAAYGLMASKKLGQGADLQTEARWSRTEFDGSPDLHRGVVRVEARQPLFRRFGRLVNEEPIVAAGQRVKASRREVLLRRADLVVQVVEGYEDVYRLQRQVVFDGQALQRADQLLRLTRARERQGRATRVDVLRVDLQRGEAQGRLYRSNERLASARADLADLLGLAPDTALSAVEPPRLEIDAPAPDEAAAIALANRLDYAQVLDDCRDAERGVRLARKRLLPDLGLFTRYERIAEGARPSEALDAGRDAWFVGLTVDGDLRSQRERLDVVQAMLTRSSALETAALVESALRRQVQQNLLALERARLEAGVARRNHVLAVNRARLARRMFEIGKGDNFSVTDAENALLDAQNKWLQSQADVSIAAYRMLRAMGTLLEAEADLRPVPIEEGV